MIDYSDNSDDNIYKNDRIISPVAGLDDATKDIEEKIRPQTLQDYVGQPAVSEQMGIFIPAAKARGEALDHVLIFGPPGLGKTTLSHIIANELNANLRQTSGPVLEKAGDLDWMAIVPLLIFTIIFAIVVIRAVTAKREFISRMASLPLDD